MQGGTNKVREVYTKLKERNTPISAFWLQDWVAQRTTSFGKQLWWIWEVDYDRYHGWDEMVHQNSAAVVDSLLYCKFSNMAVAKEFFARTLSAVTGEHFSADDLIMVGERVWNLERLYNLYEGFGKTAITLSMSRDEIISIDNEGSYFFRKIPVVSVEMASGSTEMAEAVSEALREYKIIMQRGHGCFSTDQTLEEA